MDITLHLALIKAVSTIKTIFVLSVMVEVLLVFLYTYIGNKELK